MEAKLALPKSREQEYWHPPLGSCDLERDGSLSLPYSIPAAPETF